MQFGVAERPTHANTSRRPGPLRGARATASPTSPSTGFGVALLTDAKYGYAAHGGDAAD